MVRATEDVLWSRNVEYIKAMQEALKESDLEEQASLINRVIQEQRESDERLKTAMQDAIVEQAKTTIEETEASITKTFKETLGSLAEEASSELVQAELASMQAAIQDAMENIAERVGLSTSLKDIETEFKGVEIGSNTPMSVLNDLISRYPKTTEVKG
jgi:molybdopterin converting factor small subunit